MSGGGREEERGGREGGREGGRPQYLRACGEETLLCVCVCVDCDLLGYYEITHTAPTAQEHN